MLTFISIVARKLIIFSLLLDKNQDKIFLVYYNIQETVFEHIIISTWLFTYNHL